MRKGAFVLSFMMLAAGFAAAPTALAANGVVDNHAVVKMVKLGLGEQVILAKIHASQTAFDTSPEALAKLKRAGVPAAVITAMIEPGSSNAGAAAGNANLQFVAPDGSHQMISQVRVTAEMSNRKAWIPFYHGGPETFLFIQGRHASLHTSDEPTFTTNMNPVNVRLVHMGEKKDRDARYVVFSGSTTDREVQVTTTRLGSGSWQVKPSAALKSGEEYAFLVATQLPVGCAFGTCFAQYAGTSEAYDFAVQ